MSTRAIFQMVLWCLMIFSIFSPASALTQEELVAKLEAAGYSQVRDIKSTAEGIPSRRRKTARTFLSSSTAAAKSRSGSRPCASW
jgi:hypothetical protein